MASITQIITPLPSPPKRGVDIESTFVSKANALFDALVDEVTELNTFAVQANSLVIDLEADMVTNVKVMQFALMGA